MLQKEEGNSCCHHLWIIALFESDLNQAKRIIIGRKLLHHFEDSNSIGKWNMGPAQGSSVRVQSCKKFSSMTSPV